MRLDILISSLALALVVLLALGWKWRMDLKVVFVAAIIIGALTGLVTSQIHIASAGLSTIVLLPIELALILLIAFLAVMVRFYRDPERMPPEVHDVILSPADGTIVYVNKVARGSALVSTKGERKFRLDEITSTNLLTNVAFLVGIDMNMLNVHVNRSPIEGKVIFRKRIPGSFISLRKQDSEIVNERVSTIVCNGTFSVGVVQIASRLVRKIVSFVREGDDLEIGQRIGAIVFGSQVDVAIPELRNLRITVKTGDKVKAGVSIIARYSSYGVPKGFAD